MRPDDFHSTFIDFEARRSLLRSESLRGETLRSLTLCEVNFLAPSTRGDATRAFEASRLVSSPETLRALGRVLDLTGKKLGGPTAIWLMDAVNEVLIKQPPEKQLTEISQAESSQAVLPQVFICATPDGDQSDTLCFARTVRDAKKARQWRRNICNEARFTMFSSDGDSLVSTVAATPLQDEEDNVCGALLVARSEDRVLDVAQMAELKDMATLVVHDLKLHMAWQNALQSASDAHQETHVLQQRLDGLSQHNNQLKAAVHSAPIGIVVSDPHLPNNPIIFANPAFYEMTGYEAHEFLGLNCRHLQGPATNSNVTQIMRDAVKSAQSCRHTLVNYRKDGTPFWNDITIRPVHDQDGRLINYVGIQRDVTDTIEKEALIARAHEELELRVQIRTAELSRANAALALVNSDLEKEVRQHFVSRTDLEWSRQQLRALAARIDSVQEAERMRISREIHDDLGQELTNLKMQLAWLERRVSPEDNAFLNDAFPGETFPGETLPQHLKEMSQQIDTSIRSMRRIAADLRPEVLDKFGLLEAFQWQAQEFQKKAGIRCICRVQCPNQNIPPALATTIFRITQEALTNVLRHAQATRVKLSLTTTDKSLHLYIGDNGIGFKEKTSKNLGERDIEPNSTSSTRTNGYRHGLGIIGMSERALMMGGDFSVTHRKGTAIRVFFPLNQTAPADENNDAHNNENRNEVHSSKP